MKIIKRNGLNSKENKTTKNRELFVGLEVVKKAKKTGEVAARKKKRERNGKKVRQQWGEYKGIWTANVTVCLVF